VKFPIQTIGIIGGGQLARMSAQAAQRLGFKVVVLDTDPDGPAAQVTPHRVAGRYDDLAALQELASKCDVITLEHEWVNPAHFRVLEDAGAQVFPSSKTLTYLTDKFIQRQQFALNGLAGPEGALVTDMQQAKTLGAVWGYPLVLKARHGGYDGYGVEIVWSEKEWDEKLPVEPQDWYAEQFVAFDRELAVMVARGKDGQVAAYPVVESVQTFDGHRCDTVVAPAPELSESVRHNARWAAVAAVEAVDGVGLFGVELFLTRDGSVLINEMAPRPHNSGHFTMDCCATSQFEQHIRAVCGLTLGPTHLLAGGAAMANLLGTKTGDFSPGAGVARATAAVPGAHVHWYGKSQTRAGRKMGHINMLGDSPKAALEQALRAREAFWTEEADNG
jgi:5-(carboxyamino)imidazole ribonucleotide synthase